MFCFVFQAGAVHALLLISCLLTLTGIFIKTAKAAKRLRKKTLHPSFQHRFSGFLTIPPLETPVIFLVTNHKD